MKLCGDPYAVGVTGGTRLLSQQAPSGATGNHNRPLPSVGRGVSVDGTLEPVKRVDKTRERENPTNTPNALSCGPFLIVPDLSQCRQPALSVNYGDDNPIRT